MSWSVAFTRLSQEDLERLDRSRQKMVLKGIERVSRNPLPQAEGGYGKPLGNQGGTNLTGLMKIKLKGAGLRVVYRVIRTDEVMKIIVISVRDDDTVYRLAHRRIHGE